MFLPMSCTSPLTVASTTRLRGRGLGLLRLHERLQVGDRTLHRARALHDLRQEHLPRAEEVAHDLHPVHERALDHVERARELLPRLLRVLLDEVDDAVHERVREPLLDRRLPPGEVALPLRRAARDRARVLDQPFGRVLAAVEEDVLDELEELASGCPRRPRAARRSRCPCRARRRSRGTGTRRASPRARRRSRGRRRRGSRCRRRRARRGSAPSSGARRR